MTRDLSALRESYARAGLRRVDLADDPIAQFERWWDEFAATDPYDPAACVVATADAEGQPSARYVLCRGFGSDGFVFYTNRLSRKGRNLAANPRATVLFGWLELSRQVRIEGPVIPVADDVADAYWATRPRGSQIGAWASAQSTPVADRAELDRSQAEVEARYGAAETDPPVPRPPHWGGYRVVPERIEFWQGQPNRLHDRFEYVRTSHLDSPDPPVWHIQRLAP